jgi:hypothetical protein
MPTLRAAFLRHLPVALAFGAPLGCGDQTVDSGNPVHTTATTATASTATGAGGEGGGATTTASAGGGHGGSAPTGDEVVTLVHGQDTVKVDLATLATVDVQGTPVVPLPSVWAAGALAEGVTTLTFDFEGDDGFHPSNKSKCAAYITYDELALGSLIPETRSLVWDAALGLPGCYSVKSVAKIIALDAQ